MMKNMRRGIPSLFKGGTTMDSGLEEAVMKNLQACKQLTAITKTSLGPHGMNKLIVNHLDKIFVTTDTATIMNEMEVAHPAANMIRMASSMQEREIGDGSNFVVCFAGSLLVEAEKLLRMGLHPSDVIRGFTIAGAKALELLDDLVEEKVENTQMTDLAFVTRGVKTSISSKQYGYSDFLTGLVAQACMATLTDNVRNFSVDHVRTIKILGGAIQDSEVVSGMVIGRGTEGKTKDQRECKVAMFTCSLAPVETETKGVVTLTSAQQLLDYSQQEEKDMEAIINSIADSGVTAIISGGAVSDVAAHYLEKRKILVIRLASKFMLRRLSKMLGCRPLVSLGPVAPEHQGYCQRIYVKEVGGKSITVFEQDKKSSPISTVILRASTHNTLNDVERAIDDGCNTFQAMCRDGRFLAGAGAVEIQLAKLLTEHGQTVTGLEQYAVKGFAKAFEVVPYVLADNAGYNALDAVSSLYAAHEGENGQQFGLNVDTGEPINAVENGILDLHATKMMAIKLATDVAVTILRVDKIISAKRAGGPAGKKDQGHWDKD
jgi:T-complex protein 1 subunit theta